MVLKKACKRKGCRRGRFFYNRLFLPIQPSASPSSRPGPSGGAQGRPWRPLSEELHQPFEVLGCGRQEELFRHVPQPAQPHPAQAQALLELGEQGFDLASLDG